jgi:hypothetical protein
MLTVVGSSLAVAVAIRLIVLIRPNALFQSSLHRDNHLLTEPSNCSDEVSLHYIEAGAASFEAIDANLGEMMGVHGRAVNLMRTMHEQSAYSESSN